MPDESFGRQHQCLCTETILEAGAIGLDVGYDSIRAMIEMGIVYELILPNRRKQYTVLISYDEQATSNTLSHVQTP